MRDAGEEIRFYIGGTITNDDVWQNAIRYHTRNGLAVAVSSSLSLDIMREELTICEVNFRNCGFLKLGRRDLRQGSDLMFRPLFSRTRLDNGLAYQNQA